MLNGTFISRLRKLRRMSAGEVRHRLAEHVQVRRERREYRRASRGRQPAGAYPEAHASGSPCAHPESDASGSPCTHGEADASGSPPSLPLSLSPSLFRGVPGCRRDELSRLEKEYPSLYEELARRSRLRAAAVLSGNWPLLGHPVDLRGEVDWHCDLRTGHRFDRVFYGDVSLGQNGEGSVDVKYVWELGRQQHVVELARGWLFTGEERFAARARDLVLSWIEANPLYEGVHWTSALEAAMRVVSWIWALAGLSDWDGWRRDHLERIAASLFDHGRYLERHLSHYTSPYNHLMGEATGLFLAGRVLDGSDEASRWRELGRRVLTEHGPRQFYGDGFTVEQATGYHFYTLGFLSMALAAARSEGEPLTELEPVVHEAFRAGAAFMQPDGRWPAVGDVDSARSIPVDHDDFWDFRSLCTLGAALFDDDSLRLCAPDEMEEAYWLLGCKGLEKGRTEGGEGRAGSVQGGPLTTHHSPLTGGAGRSAENIRVVLPESGYAVARHGGDWLLFDAGPLGDGLHEDRTPSTAHGHADVLQVLYCVDGEPVLIDAGMPFYFGDEEWVAYFRSPSAHNTLEVEGASVARSCGGLDWSHVCRSIELDANLSEEAWLARGRMRLRAGHASRGKGHGSSAATRVLVERYLLGVPGRGLWMADFIETDRPRTVRWYWQMPWECGRSTAQGRRRDTASRSDFPRSTLGGWLGSTGGSPQHHYATGFAALRPQPPSSDLHLAAVAGTEQLQMTIDRPADDSPVAREALGYGVHRPAVRLRAEKRVEQSLLVLTYVGRRPVPAASVAVRGMNARISDLDGCSPSCLESPPGEACWSVATEEEELLFIGGMNTPPDDGDWQMLQGAGNWPAMRLVATAAPVN